MVQSILDRKVNEMVEGLQEFISQHNIQMRKGKLVLYKAVSKEWGSLWVRSSARTHQEKLSETPGSSKVYRLGMEVNTRRVNSYRSEECGEGLHVGTLACAKEFLDCGALLDFTDKNRRLIEVLVDPEDVACVPHRALTSPMCEFHKIRCRRLVVVKTVKN
jgi:hypothetical protein